MPEKLTNIKKFIDDVLVKYTELTNKYQNIGQKDGESSDTPVLAVD